MSAIHSQVCAVIPVYNNHATLLDIVRRCRQQLSHVVVVDDGSTDTDVHLLCAGIAGVTVLRHAVNRGKGAALQTAFEYLRQHPEFQYLITLDADGQHAPEDIPNFFPDMEKSDACMLIGCRDFAHTAHVPHSSRFGRAVANFWMKIETGLTVADCQSGFRAYPLRYILQLNCICAHYNFETEILVRAAWGNLEFHDVPISVYYPPPALRVSHFKPFLDNWRLSLIHAHLTGLRCLPYPKKKLRPKPRTLSLFRPKELFLHLLHEHATPVGLGAAAGVGAFLAVPPLIGFHTLAILYVSERLHLNKIMSFAIQHFFVPPLSPLLCIELGHFLCHGKFLTTANFQTLVAEIPERLLEWLLGSLLLAPFWAVVCGGVTWGIAAFFQKRLRRNA